MSTESRLLRRFLLCEPKGETFRVMTSNGERFIERNGQTYSRLAATMLALEPTRIECLDGFGGLLRATSWGRTRAREAEAAARSKADAPPRDTRFLSLEEIAREARAPLSTVRHWTKTGYLPSVKLGKHRRVAREDFERLISTPTHDADLREAAKRVQLLLQKPDPSDERELGQRATLILQRELNHVQQTVSRLTAEQHELVALVIGLNVRVRELVDERTQRARLEPGVHRLKRGVARIPQAHVVFKRCPWCGKTGGHMPGCTLEDLDL